MGWCSGRLGPYPDAPEAFVPKETILKRLEFGVDNPNAPCDGAEEDIGQTAVNCRQINLLQTFVKKYDGYQYNGTDWNAKRSAPDRMRDARRLLTK
jgi:hypothetical protein